MPFSKKIEQGCRSLVGKSVEAVEVLLEGEEAVLVDVAAIEELFGVAGVLGVHEAGLHAGLGLGALLLGQRRQQELHKGFGLDGVLLAGDLAVLVQVHPVKQLPQSGSDLLLALAGLD